jgi:hypothetical protein
MQNAKCKMQNAKTRVVSAGRSPAPTPYDLQAFAESIGQNAAVAA